MNNQKDLEAHAVETEKHVKELTEQVHSLQKENLTLRTQLNLSETSKCAQCSMQDRALDYLTAVCPVVKFIPDHIVINGGVNQA